MYIHAWVYMCLCVYACMCMYMYMYQMFLSFPTLTSGIQNSPIFCFFVLFHFRVFSFFSIFSTFSSLFFTSSWSCLTLLFYFLLIYQMLFVSLASPPYCFTPLLVQTWYLPDLLSLGPVSLFSNYFHLSPCSFTLFLSISFVICPSHRSVFILFPCTLCKHYVLVSLTLFFMVFFEPVSCQVVFLFLICSCFLFCRNHRSVFILFPCTLCKHYVLVSLTLFFMVFFEPVSCQVVFLFLIFSCFLFCRNPVSPPSLILFRASSHLYCF